MYKKLNILVKEYKNLNLQEVIDYEKFCIISIVWHSTKIEGCSLTETDTKVLLENDIKRKLSVEFIQEICRLVMKNTGSTTNTISGSFDTSKGDLRLAQVYVDKKYFPDYRKVLKLLEQLCKSVNEKIDTVKGAEIFKLSADVHYNFVNIHPFGDGNGRISRLLMNYIQLYHNEPLIKIFTEDRVEYIDALNETEEKENLEVFRAFIVKQEIKFLNAEIDKHKKINNGFVFMF